MLRTLSVLATVFLTAFSAGQLLAQGPEIIDPAEAAKDPDFSIQGEYLGQGGGAASLEGKVAVQVIARGGGKFQAFVLKGGLPGEGWKNGDPRSGIEGKREGDKVMLKGGNFAATIADGKLTLTTADGQGTAELKPVQRKSPTLCAPPPQGALVLFDGTDAKHFPDGHMTADKNLMGGCVTADKFNDYHLHVELRLSYMPNAQGQARSNSGVYLHDCYEIQVLDSFGLEGAEQRVRRVLQRPGPQGEHVFAAVGVADLRRGLHRAEVRCVGEEDGRRPGHRPAQRRDDP
jgi:hypothetical protein